MTIGFLMFFICLVFTIKHSMGAGCNAWTGTNAKNFDDEEQTDTDLEVKLITGYRIGCSCGIVTQWRFYARKNGTVTFYVIQNNNDKIIGQTTVYVPPLSLDNYFEIPLSSEMWISVKANHRLGFYTASPMITYTTTASISSKYSTGVSKLNDGDLGTFANSYTDRRYAVGAYVETAHSPMFTNAPVKITMYTHETSTVVHTFSATDLDPGDTLTLACTNCDSNFVFDTTAHTLTYATKKARGTYEYIITIDDDCNSLVSGTATIVLLNEKSKITSLPASVTVNEKATTTANLHTIITTDASGDTVTCSLHSVSPSSGSSKFSVSSNIISHVTNPGFVYSTAKYYVLKIACSDTENTVYSNFQVDIIKNLVPAYTVGSGYLPASVAVDRTSGATIYTLAATDTEGDSFSFSKTACSQVSCPVTVTAAGLVQTTAQLAVAGYDVTIQVDDSTNTADYVLSVLVSEDPLTFNDAPVFSNLPATKNVIENTAVGTYLFQVMYTDHNPLQTFTLSKTTTSIAAVDTFFEFDATTGKVSIKANIDYDTIGSGSTLTSTTVTMTFQVSDATDTGTGVLTLVIENMNESPTIAIATSAISRDEGATDSVFTDPGLTVTDPDTTSGDTHTWSMDCGTESKYFYLNNKMVYFAREYDMDSGLSGSATCTVTVTDAAGLSDSGTITLTVANINDHIPKFPYHNYALLVSSTATFFTFVVNLTASDYDSNAFGSANGVLTYSFVPTTAGNYFQIDATGLLYVRDVSSHSAGSYYVFTVLATDSGASVGTCTVTIIFPALELTTTTTTTRSYEFEEDYMNNIWLVVIGLIFIILLVLVAFIVWRDPVVHDWITLKLFKISEMCRDKPKEPKRTVGKLTVTINKKTLENDPDNALPWELLAKDANVPEINEVQERIQARKEKQDLVFKDQSGLKVFEKGKGVRPPSGRTDVHSSSSSGGRSSNSPKYDTFKPGNDTTADFETETLMHPFEEKEEDTSDVEFGSGAWDNMGMKSSSNSVRILVSPVPANDDDLGRPGFVKASSDDDEK